MGSNADVKFKEHLYPKLSAAGMIKELWGAEHIIFKNHAQEANQNGQIKAIAVDDFIKLFSDLISDEKISVDEFLAYSRDVLKSSGWVSVFETLKGRF